MSDMTTSTTEPTEGDGIVAVLPVDLTGDVHDPAPTPEDGADERPPSGPPRSFAHRLVRGRPEDPAWVRPSLVVLLVATGILYIYGLDRSGWANSFYTAAVQAGTKSWKAFFFGSFDASNFITVDKPPASLWVMEISARLFGVNAWSVLVPQALEGVATVGVLYLTVRRAFRPGAALLAGAVLAVTPVAALMFRFNNPDALLTLILTLATYATVRAIQDGRTRWMVLAGGLIGFGFITKMMQACIILPVIALVYLAFGPHKFAKRFVQLIWTGLACLLSAGWWVAIVELIPASDRPYIGSSTDNSLFNLIFGYNGIGRLDGNEKGSVGGFGRAGSMWGQTGWNRLFSKDMGTQISWLIPAALVALLAGLWLTRKEARTGPMRATYLLFGGWLLLTGAVFSYAQGIIHPYYTVALAPAVAGLVGMGASQLWARRQEWFCRIALVIGIGVTAWWSWVMLSWTPHWAPALHTVIVVLAIIASVAVLALPRLPIVLAALVGGVGIASILAAPTAYALNTARTGHNGSLPTAGPTVAGGGIGGPFAGIFSHGTINLPPGFTFGGTTFKHGLHLKLPASVLHSLANGGGPGFGGGGGFGGPTGGGAPTGAGGGFPGGGTGGGPGFGGGGFGAGGTGRAGGGFGGGGFGGGGGGIRGGGRFGGGGGGIGSLLNSSVPPTAVTALLQHNAAHFTWVAATTGADSAAGYQLASDDPVMAIGGFNGTDPTPSLAAFERYVAEGKIHYYIKGGGFGGFGAQGSADASAIATWVAAHYTATSVGGVTLYDLTATAH